MEATLTYRHMVVTMMPRSILLLLIERKMLTEFLDDCVRCANQKAFHHILNNITFFTKKMPSYWIISLIYPDDFREKYSELHLYVARFINK